MSSVLGSHPARIGQVQQAVSPYCDQRWAAGPGSGDPSQVSLSPRAAKLQLVSELLLLQGAETRRYRVRRHGAMLNTKFRLWRL